MRSVSSDIQKSSQGIGFPSANRALATIPKNQNDPNGYYSQLGVPPHASLPEIKRVLRFYLKSFHPDGKFPDPKAFAHYKMIADVLLNPQKKWEYDHLASGTVFIDPEVRQQMDEAGIPREAIVPFQKTVHSKEVLYDFFSEGTRPNDISLANKWYGVLLHVAPLAQYTATIKVCLWDKQPQFGYVARMLYVPRSWKPTTANAYCLFAIANGRVKV